MSCSQLIHGLGSSIWGCCETPLIEGMTYFGHHDEFLMMSVHGYTFDKTYGES